MVMVRPWDADFKKWIAEARESGQDPNDIGDEAWQSDPLKLALERHYLPHINANSVVLELGPGSGRATRHVISRCREMILVDYSQFVCEWLESYLAGKGVYRIYQIDEPWLPMIQYESVDMVFANGVFEHIGLDDMSWFLEEFYRILKPGGVVAFNFMNLMSEAAIEWHRQYRGSPGDRCIFRFYHPEVVKQLAQTAGFDTFRLTTGVDHLAVIEARKSAPIAHPQEYLDAAQKYTDALEWKRRWRAAMGELKSIIPAGESFILVDEDQWRSNPGERETPVDRPAIPFLERDGQYWGPPPDDETAIEELERLRRGGARFIVFGWTTFWWLEYYSGLHQHLRSRFSCLLENDRLIVFDLAHGSGFTT